MRKCPYCAEEIQDEAIVCRFCGRNIGNINNPRKIPQEGQDLLHPLNELLYLVIGIGGLIILNIFPILMILLVGFSNLLTINGMTVLAFSWFIFELGAFLYFPTKGYSSKPTFISYFTIILWSIIPIINWIVVYYFGKGIYIFFSKQKLLAPPQKPIFHWMIPLGIIVVGGSFVAFMEKDTHAIITPTITPRPTYSYTYSYNPYPTQTLRPQSECYRWNQITATMEDRFICVYGVIYQVYQTNENATRLKFSAQPNTFFIYSSNYIFFTDSQKKELLKTGDCVMVYGTVEIFSDIPYVNAGNTLMYCKEWMK